MTILDRPAIVSQRGALLPDGRPDPAGSTDCGEACVSAALRVRRGVDLSPGCIRQALADPQTSGLTTAAQLALILRQMGCGAVVGELSGGNLWRAFKRLRHHGRLCVALGDWEGFGAGHWVLCYERDAGVVWVMDPWTAAYRAETEDFVNRRGMASQVWVT